MESQQNMMKYRNKQELTHVLDKWALDATPSKSMLSPLTHISTQLMAPSGEYVYELFYSSQTII